jgi:hypothetical protein
VTHNSSRKHFFAKLLGVVAATSVFPKLFAKTAPRAASAVFPPTPGSRNRAFEIRHDPRAVARRETV